MQPYKEAVAVSRLRNYQHILLLVEYMGLGSLVHLVSDICYQTERGYSVQTRSYLPTSLPRYIRILAKRSYNKGVGSMTTTTNARPNQLYVRKRSPCIHILV